MMIGVGLDARLGLPFGQLRAAAREAERLGFESLWTPAGGVPDSFHICAAWSQDTSLRSGISVVPAARMWTAPSLAVQAATLAQLSAGRFVLGLGTGGYGPGFWASVGLPDRPVAVMRKYVTEVRAALLGTQQVTASPTAGADTGPGTPGWPQPASPGLGSLPPAPVYLAALGPQMLRLAGETADGALLNWATPERVAVSRSVIDGGAARAGRDPGAVPMTMYIRVCIDDDAAAARQAFGTRCSATPWAAPASRRARATGACSPRWASMRELTELEQRRDRGAAMPELVAAVSDEMLAAVGYYGPAGPAPAAFARLSEGLDEAIATGTAAGPLAALLVRSGAAAEGTVVIEQGRALAGRAGSRSASPATRSPSAAPASSWPTARSAWSSGSTACRSAGEQGGLADHQPRHSRLMRDAGIKGGWFT